MASNEKEIREAVKSYLLENYNDLKIKEEFGVFLDSRNDVMGVSYENIISVEIHLNNITKARILKMFIIILSNSKLFVFIFLLFF